MKYELHPACAAWPEMPAHELIALADDITLNGLHDPIALTPDGLLLDGRNRALACEMAGIEPSTVVYGGDPVLFSLSKNRQRRHMTKDQIAMSAAELIVTSRGGNRGNQYTGGKLSNESLAIEAITIGVPLTTLASARAVAANGTAEEIADIKTGKAKVRATANKVRARKANKLNEPEEIAKALKTASGKIPTSEELSKVAHIHPRSADNVIRVIKRVEEAKEFTTEVRFTKAQDVQVEARIKAETEQLRASFETAVNQKVNEILAQRDKQDTETIERANTLLASQKGRLQKPFTSKEYTGVLLRALHPDTSTEENRLDAFKLVKSKQLLLREEGRIELRGPKLPRTAEEWEAAKAAAAAARKRKKG